MFKADSTLLIQIQLALIGIVVVVGLFYLWKIITRLEDKVNKSACKCKNVHFKESLERYEDMDNDKLSFNNELRNAEELMKQVFNGDNENAEEIIRNVFGNNIDMNQPTMVMFSMDSLDNMPEKPSSVVVEELDTNDNKEPEEVKCVNPVPKDENQNDYESETNDDTISIDTNPMSKSKLSQMKLEKLRALCKARDLPTEGLKPQLIDRLLGLTRE